MPPTYGETNKRKEANMDFEESRLDGSWQEIKDELTDTWSKLSDRDLEHTRGDLKAITRLIQTKYGEDFDATRKTVYGIMRQFERDRPENGSFGRLTTRSRRSILRKQPRGEKYGYNNR